jgi:gamma-glutamyl-gamma-aminobutyrate hydrolase PuuD
VTARSPDGIIEGAEWERDDWWMLAVQWHPEELTDDGKPWDRGVFRAFADRLKG